MIKILGINGSPRAGGNCETILNDLVDWSKERFDDVSYEVIHLRDLWLDDCKACGKCGKDRITGEHIKCIHSGKDDGDQIFKKLQECDGLILATPVYFGLPTPLLIKFLNRTRFLRHQDFKMDLKVFGVISIAGRRNGGNETTILASWLPLIRNGCIPVGNGDKTCQMGAVGWANKPGEIRDDAWFYEQAEDLFTRVYQVSKLIKAGLETTDYKRMVFSYESGNR